MRRLRRECFGKDNGPSSGPCWSPASLVLPRSSWSLSIEAIVRWMAEKGTVMSCPPAIRKRFVHRGCQVRDGRIAGFDG